MTLSFFLLLAGTASTLSSVSFKLSEAGRTPVAAAHDVFRTVAELELDQRAKKSYDVSVTVAALFDNSTIPTPSTGVRTVCGVLDKSDRQQQIMSFRILLADLGMLFACIHGDERMDDPRDMAATHGLNKSLSEMYVVDPETYYYKQPLEVWEEPLGGTRDMTSYYDDIVDPDKVPALRALYDLRAGKISRIPPEYYWELPTTLPDVIVFSYPFIATYTDEDNLSAPRTGLFYTDVRFRGDVLARSKSFSSRGVVEKLMVISPNTVALDDPVVWSNNWGQAVSEKPWALSLSYVDTNYTVLHVSGVSDPLMKAALRHVNLKLLTEDGSAETHRFVYNGGSAWVTAWRHTTDLGLTACFVLVTPTYPVCGSTLSSFQVIGGVIGAVVVVFTVLFYVFVERNFSRPLRRLAVVMEKSGLRYRSSQLRKKVSMGSHCMRFTEIEELLLSYNEAIEQIQQIDTFVQPYFADSQTCHTSTVSGNLNESIVSNPSFEMSGSLSILGASSSRLEEDMCSILVTCVFFMSYQPKYLKESQKQSVKTTKHEGKGDTTFSSSLQSVFTPSQLEGYLDTMIKLADKHGGHLRIVNPEVSVILFFRQSFRTHRHLRDNLNPHPGWAEQSILAAGAKDALSGVQFALEMGAYCELQRSQRSTKEPFAETVGVVDTQVSACMLAKSIKGCKTPSLAMSRGVGYDLVFALPFLESRTVVTEETAGFVQDRVRTIPIEAIRVGPTEGRSLDYGVVLYEALPGPVDEAWRQYAMCFGSAFSYMLQGDYRAALSFFDATLSIPGLDVGLLPQEERQTRISQLYAELGPYLHLHTNVASTHQLDRLLAECAHHIMTYNFTPYIREPLPLELLRKLHQAPQTQRLSGAPARKAVEEEKEAVGDGSAASHSLALDDGSSAGSSDSFCKHAHLKCTEIDEDITRMANFTRELQARLVKANEGPSGDPAADVAKRCFQTNASVIGVTIAYSMHGSVRDNHGNVWSVGMGCLGSVKQEPAYKQKHHVLSVSGSLAVMQFYLLRTMAIDPNVAAEAKSAEELPRVEKSPQDLVVAATLFCENMMSEHVLGYVGHCADLEGGFAAITEYYPGGNLREMMLRYGRILPRSATVRYMASILAALQFLHGEGIIHGDVRPENFLVGTDGRGKLRGFFGNYALAQRVLVRFRCFYVSPEVAAGGAVTPASDIYCAGLILLEMLSAKTPPWRWATDVQADHSLVELEVLCASADTPFYAFVASGMVVPDIPRDVDGWFKDLIDGCLCASPEARKTAGELLDLFA